MLMLLSGFWEKPFLWKNKHLQQIANLREVEDREVIIIKNKN